MDSGNDNAAEVTPNSVISKICVSPTHKMSDTEIVKPTQPVKQMSPKPSTSKKRYLYILKAAVSSEGAFDDKYIKRKAIGKGNYGTVHQGHRKSDEQKVAVKIADLESAVLNQYLMTQQTMELQTLRSCNHENITKFLDSYILPNDNLCMVMELVQGLSLRSLCIGEPMPHDINAYICSQMLNGMHYLHSNKMLHRDIKPDNILLSRDGHVKICDFGFATYIGIGDETGVRCGTAYCFAPELLKKDPKGYYMYTTSTDLWAMGITVVCMVIAQAPYYQKGEEFNNDVLFERISQGPPHIDNKMALPPDLVDYLNQCLSMKSQRVSAEALQKHEWLNHSAPAEKLGKLVVQKEKLRKERQKQQNIDKQGQKGSDIREAGKAKPAKSEKTKKSKSEKTKKSKLEKTKTSASEKKKSSKSEKTNASESEKTKKSKSEKMKTSESEKPKKSKSEKTKTSESEKTKTSKSQKHD